MPTNVAGLRRQSSHEATAERGAVISGTHSMGKHRNIGGRGSVRARGDAMITPTKRMVTDDGAPEDLAWCAHGLLRDRRDKPEWDG